MFCWRVVLFAFGFFVVSSRGENRAKALEFLRAGNRAKATEFFQRCVDVTSHMAWSVIQVEGSATRLRCEN